MHFLYMEELICIHILWFIDYITDEHNFDTIDTINDEKNIFSCVF